MKIMTNRTFNDLLQQLTNQAVTIDKLLNENKKLKNENKKLKNDIRCLKNIYSRSDIIFPNTDERGLGDSETPTNYSEKYF